MKSIVVFLIGAIAGALALFFSPVYMSLQRAALPAAPVDGPGAVVVKVPATPMTQVAAAPGYVDVPEFDLGLPVPLPAVAVPPLVEDPVVPLEHQLLIPVAGVLASSLKDSFHERDSSGHFHEAIDIAAAKGTPVQAVADGSVAKLITNKQGGLTVYQFDSRKKFAYYYAHLDRYAPNLKEGMRLKRGDPLGLVGTSGNADPANPHVHFATFALGTEKQWWKGSPINPYPLFGGERPQPAAK
jgi:murein DD-endopeptidase MepM/ murein hydrolase activator NlpD